MENKIKANDNLAKSAGTRLTSIETNLNGFKKSDLTSYAKKADVATDITTIKNNYVTIASLSSRLNDLKSQHVADEVKKVEDKVKGIILSELASMLSAPAASKTHLSFN